MAYVCRELPSLTPERAKDVEDAIRGEYGGERVYIATGSAIHRRLRTARRVLQLFNGRNATEVARELSISKATVYRVLKQPGVSEAEE